MRAADTHNAFIEQPVQSSQCPYRKGKKRCLALPLTLSQAHLVSGSIYPQDTCQATLRSTLDIGTGESRLLPLAKSDWTPPLHAFDVFPCVR